MFANYIFLSVRLHVFFFCIYIRIRVCSFVWFFYCCFFFVNHFWLNNVFSIYIQLEWNFKCATHSIKRWYFVRINEHRITRRQRCAVLTLWLLAGLPFAYITWDMIYIALNSCMCHALVPSKRSYLVNLLALYALWVVLLLRQCPNYFRPPEN